MTKNRLRRISSESDRSTTSKPAVPASLRTNTTSRRSILLTFLLTSFFFPLLAITLYRLKYPTSTPSTTLLSVYERGLVKPHTTFQEIIAENSRVSKNTSRRHFPHPVLAYITPWNSKGYEMAKRFTSKFTHLSPVWYELKSEESRLVLEGRHNADIGWISELRMNGDALVLPRVVLEVFPAELLRKKKQWDKAIDLIVKECKDMGYDGIVLESWSRWAAYGVLQDPDLRLMALQFIQRLGQTLHSISSKENSDCHLQLVYVIPAPRSRKLENYDFGPKDFQHLSEDVDGFSLMTYDFSGPHSPGPNAPLNWIKSSLQMILGTSDNVASNHAHQIFLGISFYGNDFVLSKGLGGGAITGGDYLSLLEKHKPVIQWEDKVGEHFFIYSNDDIKHAVFYPSLMSISMRLDEARSWGAGISIWEIGQVNRMMREDIFTGSAPRLPASHQKVGLLSDL